MRETERGRDGEEKYVRKSKTDRKKEYGKTKKTQWYSLKKKERNIRSTT